MKTSVKIPVLAIAILSARCSLCSGQDGNDSLLRGAECAVEGRFTEARAQYSKVLKDDPLLPNAEAALEIMGDAEQQRIQRETAIYLFKGIDQSQKGNDDEALADFSKAVNLNLGYAMTYNMRGIVYAFKGEYDKAMADFETAIRIDPKAVLPYLNRGITYKLTGQYDRAISDYDKAIRINPTYAVIYYNRAIANKSRGQLDKAISDYSTAIQISPRYAEAYCNRASLYRTKRQYRDAMSDLNTSIELDPGDALAYNNRGILYLVNFKDHENGCLDLKKACELGECDTYEAAKKDGACEYLHVK